MTLKGLVAVTALAFAGQTVQAAARAPCQQYVELRNAASHAWKEAMTTPRPDRCAALDRASMAADATLKYAEGNRGSCNISVQLLNQVAGQHRETLQARDNVCAGRPLRAYPADIIQR